MKKISPIIVFLSLLCISCKEIHCPEFPANLNYFPYENGQELKFKNTQGDIRNFTIISKENSIPESFTSNCKCACDVYTGFKTNPNQDNISIECRINISGREEFSRVYIHNFIANISDDNDMYIYMIDFLNKEIDIREFGITSKNFKEIEKHLKDTISIESDNNQLIKKIVLVKNRGLLSYTTTDDEEWNLIE